MRHRTHQPVPNFDHRGQTLIMALVATAVSIVILLGFASWAIMTLRAARQTQAREQALLLAEAGYEYYRWHLAHSPTDFQDGTGGPGPYVHDYYDKDGELLGTFTLDITAPPTGSSIVTIKSTGSSVLYPSTRRAIEARVGKASWAKYAVVANAQMRFGSGTEVFGTIHSNDGIRFDGVIHNVISSSVEDYDDPDHSGGNEFGVHTHVSPTDPLPPTAVPSRPDVFEAGREFPLPEVDFDGISTDLAGMKSDAQDDGFYQGSTSSPGYHIVLKTDDTFDLYRVTSVHSPPSGCDSGQDYWGTWSIDNQTFVGNYGFPNNGIIFVEDHVWVSGQMDGARLTIAAADFPESPSTYRHITVNEDLLYTHYDGTDSLALIAQGNFNVGLYSQNVIRIDGAVIAQNGRVGRHYYESDCGSSYVRNSLTLYGMIGTNQRYGFAYTDNTGYDIRNLIYDSHLLYAPPPAFPATTEFYELISWREVVP
jgi:type II secretory pathway pseudopilin PulG